MKILVTAGIVLGTMVLGFVFSLLSAIPTYFVWNWLMPLVWKLPVLTFWQVWGHLFLLAVMGELFKTSVSKS